MIWIQYHPSRPALLMWSLSLLFLHAASAQTIQRTWADTLLAQRCIKESKQFHKDGKTNEALQKAQEALAIYTDLHGKDHQQPAVAALYVARELRDLRRDQEAVVFFEHSLRVFKTVHDTFRMALCHNLVGSCQRSQHRYAEARQHIQTAIGLIRRDSAKLASTIADFKINLAHAFNAEKNYLAAIPWLEAAVAVHILGKNTEGLGFAYYHLGGAYFGLHDYVRAKENYLTALGYLKVQLRADHSYFTDLLVNVGVCCQRIGDPETGLAYMLEAKETYLKSKDTLHYMAFLQLFGEFFADQSKFEEAIGPFEECLHLKETRFGANSVYFLRTLQSLGEACTYTRQFVKAEAYCQRGLSTIRDLPGVDQKLAYRFYSDLAALRLAQGDYSGSLQRCDTAFAIAGFDPAHPDQMLPRDVFRELCQRYARSLVQQFLHTNDTRVLSRAESYFDLSAQILYREMAEVTVNSSREIFYDRDHIVLEQWLDTQMMLYEHTKKAGHAESAFQIGGQSKAFLLADAMRRNGALRYAGVPDSVLQAELSLREQIVAAEKTLDAPSRLSVSSIDTSTLSLNTHVAAWRDDYDALLHRIEQTYPEYFRLRLLQHNIPTAELRKNRLAAGQALLMYSLTDAHAYAFVLTRDTFCAVALPADDGLAAEVQTMRKSLTEYFTVAEADDALYDRALETYIGIAQSLYQKLVLPVAHLLPGRVVVMPEGALCYLPFEALLTGAPTDAGNFRTYPFWIRQKALSYSLSTEHLVETTLPSPLKAEKIWLGIAPFNQDQPGAAVASTRSRHRDFLPLPFSGKEVTAIANLLHGETWLGADARPGRFEKEGAQYRILHLATHSRVNDHSGHYSYIAASSIGDPLYAKDLYLLSLAAEMVVLSSCEAGGGKLLRGEGIIGMVRAFTFAGARSVVAPLWVANDQSTANLMVDFYRNLRKGQPKDLALQSARIKMMDQSPDAAHPFFWAGFRVYGQVMPLWK